MARIIVGHFKPDGGLIYLPIGYVPDKFTLYTFGSGAGVVWIARWFERMQDDEASGEKEGWLAKEGITTILADNGGIAAYDTGSELPTVTRWATGQSATQRTATARGTLFKATTSGVDANGNAIDESAIFECVNTGTTDGSNEPPWSTVLGENGPSDNGVIWQKVNIALLRGGYKGVRIAAALMVNDEECYYEALQADNSINHGDVDGWAGGIEGA